MLDRELTNELHRVADATPVPDDLFPADRLKRGGARRPWAMVAAAAVALLALGFSPLGQKAVDAATQWVMTYKVKVVSGPVPARGFDLRTIQVGETVEETNDLGVREVHRGVKVADLTGWVLPTYLPPEPTTKAVLTESYRPGEDAVFSTTLWMDWRVSLEGETKSMSYSSSRHSVSAQMLDDIRSGKKHAVEAYGLRADQVKQQTVSIKGYEATATLLGKSWSLHWWHEGGSGFLSGNLPLEELLKVAESLPSLE